MASALDRLRKLNEDSEEEEQGATKKSSSDTPANAKSKAAYNELLMTGKTTYGGKTYTLPEGELSVYQKYLNDATAGASQDVARWGAEQMAERKAAEPEPVKTGPKVSASDPTPWKTVTDYYQPVLEEKKAEANKPVPAGFANAKKYLDSASTQNVNPALAGTLAAGLRAGGQEWKPGDSRQGVSSKELYTNADLMTQTARAAGMQRDEMARQLVQNPSLMYDADFAQGMNSLNSYANTTAKAADRLMGEYNQVVNYRNEKEEKEKFGDLYKNEDYIKYNRGNAELAAKGESAVDPKLNRYTNIYRRQGEQDWRKKGGDPTLSDPESFLTDREAGNYFYIAGKQGLDAANEYYKNYLKADAEARKNQAVMEYTQKKVAEGNYATKAAYSGASIVMNKTSVAGMLDLTFQNLRQRFGDASKPINYNTKWQLASNQADAIVKQVSNDIAKDVAKAAEGTKWEKHTDLLANAATFFYQTVLSTVDSGTSALLVGLGLPEQITLGLMAGNAGMSAIRDAKERGASDGQALASGYAAAFAEYMFEKVSLDQLLEAKNIQNFGQFVKEFNKQGFVEGSEEFATEWATTLTDLLINGDKSSIGTDVQRYMANGVSEKEARKAAAWNWTKNIAMSYLGGYISGGLMQGGNAAVNIATGGNSRLNLAAQVQVQMAVNQAINDNGRVDPDAVRMIENNPEALNMLRGTQAMKNGYRGGATGKQQIQSAIREIAKQERTTRTVMDHAQQARLMGEYTRMMVEAEQQNEGRTVPAPMEEERTLPAEAPSSAAPAAPSPEGRQGPPVPQNLQTAQEERIAETEGRNEAQERATPPLPQQAGQITPESVTTPPLPGNAQRGTERQKNDVPADIKTGVPVQDGVTGAAETSRDNVAQQGEAVKGPPVPGRTENAPRQSPAATVSPRGSQDGGLRIPGSRAESNATVKALQTVSPELLEAYMTEGTDGDTTISDAVAAVQREVQKGTISARAGAEFLDMMWQAGSDAESRNGFLKSIYDTNTGDLRPQALNAVQRIDARNRNGGLRIGQAENPAAAVGQQARTGQAEAATAAAAAEAGNDLADGGRGRIPGQRTGEQNGRLAEAKRAVSQYNKASGRRADAKNLRAEEVDARERIPAAAKGSKITLAPEQMVQQDKELRTVAQRLEQITGKKVYYTIGNIQRQGAGGRVSQARGAITADGIYLRCDHNDLSVTQLAAHELYHYYEQLYPGLSARMKEKIIQTYSEEEFNKVAKVYVEKLGAINGLTDNQDAEAREAALARIEKEIFADAFGSINYGGAKADRFNALVRQTLNETMGAETEAATARKTGPPETQFSTQEESLQERIDRAKEMLDNDAPTSQIFRETGLVALTSGKIQDGIGGEIVGRYNRGRSDERRMVPAGTDDGADGRKAGRGLEASPQRAERRSLEEWETLHSGDKGRIAKAVENKMKSASREGRAFYKLFDNSEQFAQRFYNMLQQDRIVAEQWSNIIPDIDSLMDELEEIGTKKTDFSADEEEEIPQSAAEYARMKERDKKREAELLRLVKKGEATEAQKQEAAALKEKLKGPKAAVKKQQATIAKKQLRNTIISEFGIPDGRKAEIGKMIDAYADRLIKEKEISWSDRLAFFKKLYDEGVMTVPADDMYQAAREIVRGGKVYVSEKIKHEFGDDWASFRRQAFAEGIYLTNNPADKSADSWNVELSSEFPGMFPEDNYDQKDILERIVSAAQAGRDEQMSLAEYAAKVVGQEYVSEDEAMDNMERRLDWALRSFADKAGLETWLKDKAEEKLAKQREQFGERLDAIRAQEIARQAKERDKRKEAARKQTLNRELREMQQRTLKQLQWLSKNRQKFSGNMQDQLNEILSDIDVYAISAADEAHLDKASNKTWRELADIYKDAKENDPNFLPSKDLECIVARLDNRKIGDMDIDAVTDLYKAAVGLRTELYNRNNVIGSELHETFQEVYDQVKDEMQSAKGGYKTGAKGLSQKFFSDLQLTPMNVLERMAGWNKDSAWYKMAKQLEQGERAQRKFKTDSARMLAPFLEEHKDWVKKADGQGKDAIWYEVEVPELLELGMGDKPIFGNTVKVYMTPAQKVHMYLESQNYDNLRHMTGGRTFADRELYSKGKRAEAFAQGKTIRLAPETVKNLVKDLTAEEKALADALRPFYNDFSKKEINRVSNLLLGYNKAMEGDYAPIYTNKNYTQSEPGIFDTTAEGVGNLKSRVVSSNPSLNISALDAFEKSVDRTSRYVGLAVPVRNMNTLMNWREKGNSMADVLTHKWGQWALAYINGGSWEGENGKKHNEIGLLNELQGGRPDSGSSIEALTDAALSKYISAVFGANPSIVLKQFASYPLAAAYLGWENMPVNIPRAAQVDTDLIAKYTGEYDYRQLGYAMPETATLKDNPGKLQEKGPLNFIFGGGAITWMDGFTVRTLWSWAENKVNKEQPGLERGSQAQIDAGNSEYYKAVAAEFEEALSRSQPMYDTMHRANIMRESNPITRAFTLFKTVPMQEYNMLRQAIGEAQYAKEANLDKETQAAARQKAGRAFAGILAGNLMIGAITVLNALWKNRGKKYRDEDGNISAEKLIAEAGKQYFKDAAGLVIGGGEAADLLSSILFGDKWYGLETPGMEQIESIMEQTVKAGLTVGKLVQDSIEVLRNGGNWAQYMADHSDIYLSAVDSVARTLGTYATGLPIDNVKAYLLGAVQWLSPEVKTAYEDILDKADRSGLKGLSGASLEIRTKHIIQERAGSADDETVEALAGLYAAGYKDAIPAAQVTKITVDGEERLLNLAQQQTYKRAWQETVGGSIDELVSSKDFQNADEATQAKMLKKLYDLANKKAASALFDDYEDSAIEKADAYTEAGASLADYAAMSGAVSGQKRAESYETITESAMSDEAKLAAIGNIIGTDMVTETGNPTQWARLNTAVKDGLSVDDAVELMQEGLLDDYDKWRGSDAKKEKIGWEVYRKYKADTNAMSADKDENGKSISGTKKTKVLNYIDGLNLTAKQKDTLYYDAGYAESGLSDTPWHKGGGKGSGSYAMARTPALRIPEAPKAEKIQSGLRISTGEPTQRQSSGLRIRGTQPGEARQGSGLRIRDAAPAAQAPRSGLRIRAK
jgi:hypothetical protein